MDRSSTLVDRLEKVGRLVLWLALAGMCVAVPIGMLLQAKAAARIAERAAFNAETERREKLKADQQKANEEAEKPAVLSIGTMGAVFSMLQGATGHVWFTNASRQSGVVCVKGRAMSAKGATESLASCQAVEPFSSVNIKMMFAGAETSKLCQPDCDLDVNDAKVR